MFDHDVSTTTSSGSCAVEPGECAGCGRLIQDRYYLVAVGRAWHDHCLRCADCGATLDGELTCFCRDGHVYCKEDYYRRFAVRTCSGCNQQISSHELVMRARDMVYHVTCFSCAHCNTVLQTGDQFGIQDDMIFCQNHYDINFQPNEHCHVTQGIPGDMTSIDISGNMNSIYGFPGVTPPSKGRPRKRKNQHLHEHETFGALLADELGPDGYPLSNNSRQKRIRTSFKHHQLRILKSYFALNQNPDAKDLKQLSQKTGLTKRVLQVWFQNARAKYRRNLLKDGSAGVKDSIEEASPQKSPSDNTQNSFNSDTIEDSSDHMTDMTSPSHVMDSHMLDPNIRQSMMNLALATSTPLSELYNSTVHS